MTVALCLSFYVYYNFFASHPGLKQKTKQKLSKQKQKTKQKLMQHKTLHAFTLRWAFPWHECPDGPFSKPTVTAGSRVLDMEGGAL